MLSSLNLRITDPVLLIEKFIGHLTKFKYSNFSYRCWNSLFTCCETPDSLSNDITITNKLIQKINLVANNNNLTDEIKLRDIYKLINGTNKIKYKHRDKLRNSINDFLLVSLNITQEEWNNYNRHNSITHTARNKSADLLLADHNPNNKFDSIEAKLVAITNLIFNNNDQETTAELGSSNNNLLVANGDEIEPVELKGRKFVSFHI